MKIDLELNHIALTITTKEDINNFYIDLLGFNFVYENILPNELNEIFFQMKTQTYFCLLEKENIKLELFLKEGHYQPYYNHICFNIRNLDYFCHQAIEKNYEIIRKKRNNKDDLIFLKDHSGNLFELKQKIEE